MSARQPGPQEGNRAASRKVAAVTKLVPSTAGCRTNGRQCRHELAAQLRPWAHAYARRGWRVFPLARGTKVPALPRRLGGRGYLDASTDPAVILRMWTRFPMANIGIATGKSASIAVLDVDPRHGGEESLAELVTAHGPLSAGPVVSTPTGGRHYYFRWRPGLTCSAGQLGPGLDVRADGGYVVGPPSIRLDGKYEWLTDPRTALSDWPDWLIPARPEPVRQIRDQRAVEAANADRVLAGLVRVVADAPQGTRNQKLFWSACRLAEHAHAGRLHLDLGAAALLDAARQAGLSDTEAHRTIDSAIRRAVAA